MGETLEFAVGILNGAVGDYLARTGNGLATELSLVHAGRPIAPRELAGILPAPTGRLVVLLHGLMCTESIWAFPDGTDYGSRLAVDLGFTPLYVRYNSGRAIPDNGAALHALLEAVTAAWPVPVEEIVPIGYSMGGLVVRSACHVAPEEGGWLARVRRAFYVGTPHRGAPMERLGRVTTRLLAAVPDPYVQLAAELGELRSDGIKDLGDADLRHADRARRVPTYALRDRRHPVPLLPSIRHHLVAGSLPTDPRFALWFGDTVVPVESATDGAVADRAGFGLPPDRVRVVRGVSHVGLAHHPEVYAHLRAWCGEPA